MKGVILHLTDYLKDSVHLLARAGNTLPEDAGLDSELETLRRVFTTRKKAAKGLEIEIPEQAFA